MTYHFTTNALVFFLVMLGMVAVGALLALWVVRDRLRLADRVRRQDRAADSLRSTLRFGDDPTIDRDVAALVEACRRESGP
jgi:hypothetical protein